jgi:hypothetical protein
VLQSRPNEFFLPKGKAMMATKVLLIMMTTMVMDIMIRIVTMIAMIVNGWIMKMIMTMLTAMNQTTGANKMSAMTLAMMLKLLTKFATM